MAVGVIERWVDAAVGETREVLLRDGVPQMVRIRRWSDIGRRALWGEVYRGRVRRVEARLGGAFVDIGLGDDGYLKLDRDLRAKLRNDRIALHEGMKVEVRVVREAARSKGPVVDLHAVAAASPQSGLIERPEADIELDEARPADADTRQRIDALLESLLDRSASIPGGGRLSIEPTEALVAIDVDGAGRSGGAGADRFATALNVAAAKEALRQVRLRNLGGLIVIDFVSMHTQGGREAVIAAVRSAAVDDPWGVVAAPLSRFGLCEIARGQLRTPLFEQLLGAASAETTALRALRAIEREAGFARGRRLVCRVASPVARWLESDLIGWRAALTGRIGPLFSFEESASMCESEFDVEASP